jgi:hypothetical protein
MDRYLLRVNVIGWNRDIIASKLRQLNVTHYIFLF